MKYNEITQQQNYQCFLLLLLEEDETTARRDEVTDDVMKQLLMSLVLSRLDYCNSILLGFPLRRLFSMCRTRLPG